jgi:hypothetical protein
MQKLITQNVQPETPLNITLKKNTELFKPAKDILLTCM